MDQNNGIDLYEVKCLVTSAIASVASLKDSVPGYWSGPAAVSYQDILAQSVDFSHLKNLLEQLECEIGMAMTLLADQRAEGCSAE